MPIEEIKDLTKFLQPFPVEIREMAFWLREFAWKLYPETNELVYDNYNAVAFGWSLTEKQGNVFCSIAVGRSSHNVHFGFYFGNELSDPGRILLGNGNQYRYILVKNKKDLFKNIFFLPKPISQKPRCVSPPQIHVPSESQQASI